MGQKKLVRFKAIREFDNVLEYPENMAGKWNEFFNNNNGITLELACGKGEYTLGLAQLYPERNFIGVDLKGNRIWKGAKTALEGDMGNVAFLRTQIDQITDYFAPGEVEEIWITFPDPQLRRSKLRKRLTHPKFLRKYQQILQSSGMVHLKTDSPDLYRFTNAVIQLYDLRLLSADTDIYAQPNVSRELSIQTHYEQLDIAGSNRVHYLCFLLNAALPEAKDAILKEITDGPVAVAEHTSPGWGDFQDKQR